MTTYDHGSRTTETERLPYSNMRPGDLVQFDYRKKGEQAETRRVFVVAPDYEGKLHGFDIQYLSQGEVVDLYREVQEDVLDEAEQEASEDALPVLAIEGETGGSTAFYENVSAGFSPAQNAYRTFERTRVTSPVPVRIEFEVSEAKQDELLEGFETFEPDEL
jgi:hypothetical protein